MNIAEVSIRNHVVTGVFAVLMVVGGIWAYSNLPRLEDPEFTIKEALVITPYPGATAKEVAEEVSNVIEMAAQELGQLDKVTSRSERGLSTVTVRILDQYDGKSLPQVWDELRRRVSDAHRRLPPGAGPSLVIDNFGDVFGVYFALTGEGFSHAEMYEVAKMLQRELLLVDDVKRVSLLGVQQEVIYIEMLRDQMARLEIHPRQVAAALREQNMVVSSGRADAGPMSLAINPTGEWTGIEDFENLLIRGGAEGTLVFLRDIAIVRRDFMDPPTTMKRYNGEPAIGIGISTVSGGNVVSMGEGLKKRLAELEDRIPLGMELHTISFQADSVTQAINEFVMNLAMAVGIVFIVLLVAMGLRSGFIIGSVLFITMCATMIAMLMTGSILERISLGALIIALGMLVDNAIVITEGMLVAIKQGKDRLMAAKSVVAQTAFPLLGSTAIAIMAFGAIGLSQDSTGEYTNSLFVVLLLSLGLSWVTAMTITPLFCFYFLKAPDTSGEDGGDPYQGKIYKIYRGVLDRCMRNKTVFLICVAGVLVAAGVGFQFVDRSFFPDSTREQVMIDVWLPVGTRLDETDRQVSLLQEKVAAMPGVTNVTTVVGEGALRFILTYAPERADTAFAQMLVDVEDHQVIGDLIARVQEELPLVVPDALVIAKRFLLGPGSGGRVQVRFSGPDHDVLRQLAGQAMDILAREPTAKGVRMDCREQVPVIRPEFSETQARLAGITRSDLGQVLQSSFSGLRVGTYRESDNLLPIVARSPEWERNDADYIRDAQIFSPATNGFIPVRQVVSGFCLELEDPIILRRDRRPTITVHADQTTGLASTMRDRVVDAIEAIALPPGYIMEWGGEYESSRDAQQSVIAALPVFLILMVLIVICLFNSLRVTALIWLTVPLAAIGVVCGLLVFRQPFGFMAMLGALSLSGMLIKNSIVLIDEINLLLRSGKEAWDAVVGAAVSRLRPVSMAALTTVFGLVPLLFDVFFGAMAVTIVVGLLFASVLTLLVVPVLYVTFFGLKPPARSS